MSHRPLKITGGTLVVLAVAYVGASWYAGRLAQQSIESWVLQANQKIAAQWGTKTPVPTLRVASYDRGILSSKVNYVIAYPDEQGVSHELGLQDALQHGPWPLAALLEGHWSPLAAYSRVTPVPGDGWKAWMAAVPQGVSPWVARSRIGFTGDVATVVQFAPAKADGVDFSGGSLQFNHDAKQRQMTLTAHFGRLSMRDSATQATLTMSGLKAQSTDRSTGDSDRAAHQKISLDGMEFVVPGGATLALQQQSLTVDVAQTGSLMDSQARYQAQHARVGAQDMGQLELALSAQNLAVPALQALTRTMTAINAAHPVGSDLSPQEQQQVRDSVVPVLAASPRLTLQSLRWTNTQGTTKIKAQADFRPVGDPVPPDLDTAIEQGIHALSLHLKLSKPMLLQALRQSQTHGNPDMTVALVSMIFDQYAGRLERVGLLKQAAQGVVQADLHYADGLVTANGVQMTPMELGARLNALQGGPF